MFVKYLLILISLKLTIKDSIKDQSLFIILQFRLIQFLLIIILDDVVQVFFLFGSFYMKLSSYSPIFKQFPKF